MRLLRLSFATRLLAGALAIVLTVLAGISVFLIVSRDRATRGTAIGNAENRAAVGAELLSSVTAATGKATVKAIAIQPGLATALGAADAATLVPQIFSVGTFTAPLHVLAILDPRGNVLYSNLQYTPGLQIPAPTLTSPSVVAATQAPKGVPVAGLEVLGGSGVQPILAVDAAMRVEDSQGNAIGFVVDIAPLLDQVIQFAPVIGSDYLPVVVGAAVPSQVVRVDARNLKNPTTPGTTPPVVVAALGRADLTVSDTYDAPLPGAGTTQVAASFVAVKDATGRTTAFLGVEVPVSLFAGDTRSDETALLFISLFVILVVGVLVVLFVARFVRTPVERLERGVARIADGDYSTDIPVRSSDELGRLAHSVNRMRAQIASDVAEIEGQRAFLDKAVERLGGVSRALTTTTEGVGALQRAVVRAATSLSGPQTAAVIYARQNGVFTPIAMAGVSGSPCLEDWGVVDELVAGHGVRVETAPEGWQAGGLLALPMFYQDEVTGALAMFTAPGVAPRETELTALSILANNAAIALENTRLFEQEKDTVQRLRELDAMKSDFLATVQHELRTPLTAIMGMSDLLEMCWAVWDDKEKLDAVSDIQLASKNLYEIVETIIDFSLLERDTLGLRPTSTPVRPAVEDALRDISSRTKDGLPVAVDIAVDRRHNVWADPDRLGQVLRALLDNAAKFSAPGSTVRVRSRKQDGMLRLEIVDHGVGIPAESISRIFDRFYQVDNSATRQFGGTGMGLALVRRLVEAHGARIEVESELGRGTRFSIMWPVTEDTAGGELSGPSSNGRQYVRGAGALSDGIGAGGRGGGPRLLGGGG